MRGTLKLGNRTRRQVRPLSQDQPTPGLVHANADITTAGQAREIIAFADR